MNKPIFTQEDVVNINSVIHNFDVSIVMPFYKKLDEMTLALPLNAPFFQRNGIEIVLVLDEDSQQDGVLALIEEYPFINWRVVVNHLPHEWRNPAKAINVGIRHATKKYVMVCSPESEFYTDAIYLLRNTLEEYPEHFAVGTVAFTLYGEEQPDYLYSYVPYGSIMAEREHLMFVSGYNEQLTRWGGDDDNIRARLEIAGIKKLIVPEVKLHHREKDKLGKEKRTEKRAQITTADEIEIYYPNSIKINDDYWGRDFDDVIYDWRYNRFTKKSAEKYLNKFETYSFSEQCTFSQQYSRILLAQSYNESELILDFLENMALYFDGIILLDDGSTDDTYEKAVHPKLLLKVKKKREGFIDIENRNILLDLATFFPSEWLCFMDTDEHFDERFADFDTATFKKEADILSFSFVNIWNSSETYNAEYPFSRQGIMTKMRMFRNIGYCQIHTDKERVHFSLMPYQRNIVHCDILFQHFGMITKELREEKYNFYQKEDIARDQKSYEHMLNHDAKLLKVEDIRCRNGFFYDGQNERFDIVLSVGNDCRPAYYLKKNNLRHYKSPLDWMGFYSLDTVIHLYKTEFNDFFADLIENKQQYSHGYIDRKNNILSVHYHNIESENEAFRTKMRRRFEIINKVLLSAKRICFISNRNENIEVFKNFMREMEKMYSGKITHINIRNNEEMDDSVNLREEKISENLEFIEYEFKDVHPKGNDATTNKDAWMGNYMVWNHIIENEFYKTRK